MTPPRLAMGLIATLIAGGVVVAGWSFVRSRLRDREIGPRDPAPGAGWLALAVLWAAAAAMVWWPLGSSLRIAIKFLFLSLAAVWLAAALPGWGARPRGARAPAGHARTVRALPHEVDSRRRPEAAGRRARGQGGGEEDLRLRDDLQGPRGPVVV